MLDELERLHQAATPGPWYSNRADPAPYEICSGNPRTPDLLIAAAPEYGVNADLIVAAVNALPALLAAARAARYVQGVMNAPVDRRGVLVNAPEALQELDAALAALEGAEGRE